MTDNRETIIRMAREAGFVTGSRDYADGSGAFPYVQSVATASFLGELERFVALVAAAEREACASLVENGPAPRTDAGNKVEIGLGARTAYARAIRAKGLEC